MPLNCDTRIMNTVNEIWHTTNEGTKWIFVLPKPTLVTIKCKNSEPTDGKLQNKAILFILPKYKLYTSSTVIVSVEDQHNNYLIKQLQNQ